MQLLVQNENNSIPEKYLYLSHLYKKYGNTADSIVWVCKGQKGILIEDLGVVVPAKMSLEVFEEHVLEWELYYTFYGYSESSFPTYVNATPL